MKGRGNLKYVVVREHNGFESAILFGDGTQHSQVSVGGAEVIGAGFCSFEWNPDEGNYDVNVWGKSISLTMESKESDALIIQFAFD